MSAAVHDIITGFHRAGAPRAGLAERISATWALWRTRIGDRQALAKLDSRDLRDLRLSRWEVDLELSKPFWRG